MGSLKELLDQEFQENDSNPINLQNRFCEILRKNTTPIDQQDFSSVMNYALKYFQLPENDLCRELSASKPTLYRWMEGKSAPYQTGRQSVLQVIADYMEKKLPPK